MGDFLGPFTGPLYHLKPDVSWGHHVYQGARSPQASRTTTVY